MRPIAIIGILLAILGGLALAYQGFTYVTTEKVADFGSVELWGQTWRTVWVPPIVGIVALALGLFLLAVGLRPRAEV